MVDVEEFRKLPYAEQLKVLMEEARKANDIYAMLIIDDKMKELRKESKIPPMAKQ
ncbi:MAG: hypothetical protein OEW95_11705 [Candidatus Bathyarchaeota archaeon]|nr:hypothetical protein [Candidatus Bathyarchaeota archaeon]